MWDPLPSSFPTLSLLRISLCHHEFNIVSNCHLDISSWLSYRLVKYLMSEIQSWILSSSKFVPVSVCLISTRTTIYPIVWEKHWESSLRCPFHLSHPIYLNISQGYLFFKCQHSQAIAWAIEITCEFTSIWFCSLRIHAKLNWSFQMQKQCYSQN